MVMDFSSCIRCDDCPQLILFFVIVAGSAMCLDGFLGIALLRGWVAHGTRTFTIICYPTIWNETNVCNLGGVIELVTYI